MIARILILLLFLYFPNTARALDFEGNFTQGGFVYSQTAPSAEVTLNGIPVVVSPDGFFILGFGHDHPETATLQIKAPNGSITSRVFKIEQRHYDIENIDGLPDEKVSPRSKGELAKIESESRLKKASYTNIQSGEGYKNSFIMPAQGRISGVYGSQRILNNVPKRPHFGLDIAAPIGTAVVAPADGIVTLAQRDMFYEGNTLFIDHGLGLVSYMIHLSEIDVKQGQHVRQGNRIGRIGMSGRATGPHLHWGMKLRGVVNLDPQLTIPAMQHE